MNDRYQLSPIQRRLLAQAGPRIAGFGTSVTVATAWSKEAIAIALGRVCARHEILGSSFVQADPGIQPAQLPGGLSELVDTRTAPDVPWPTGDSPLVRIQASGDGGVVLAFSPLAADAGTVPLILRELAAELCETPRPQAPEYSMMTRWLDELEHAPESTAPRVYWQDVLSQAGPEWLSAGPAATEREPAAEASWPVLVSAEDLAKVREAAAGPGIAAALACAWARQVCALRDAERCLVGVYVDGRIESDTADLMGPLGRYAPVWLEADASGSTVSAALDRCARTSEMLPMDLVPGYRFAFDYLDLRSFDSSAQTQLSPVRVRSRSEDVGVRLSVIDLPDQLSIEVRAAPGSLDERAGSLLADRVGHALTLLAREGTDYAGAGTELVSRREREILDRLGAAPVAVDGPAESVLTRVDWHIENRPDAAAVSTAEREFSYAELGSAVHRSAVRLRALNVAPGDRVIVRLPRGLGLVATLLATWRCGATAVPVDVEIPEARLAEIIEDCRPVAVVDGVPAWSELAATIDPTPFPATADSEAGAYIIYTSGSTGRPKGVQVSAAALATHCTAIRARLGITQRYRTSQMASPAFDAAIEQIFATLTAGATLCILPQALASSDELTDFIHRQRVSLLDITPSQWQVLSARWEETGYRPQSIGVLVLGAERVTAEHIGAARRLLPDAQMWNAYGPTESVITATVHRITSAEDADVIGRTVGGRSATVRDRRGRVSPLGAVGELWLCGICLADGYYGDPAKTAERFPVDENGIRWLRTGDLVSMRPDGSLRFHGRQDRQVKLRGHRIELDEIEARCRELPGVAAAAVCLAERDGAADLVAFLESEADQAGQSRWRDLLAERLPRPMRPGRLIVLDRLPRLSNDKIDYRLLTAQADHVPATRPAPPATQWEREVARIWGKALNRAVDSRDADFFELGGHSLAAMQVVSELREAGQSELRAADLFAHHTVRTFAQLLDAAGLDPANEVPVPTLRLQPEYAYRPSHAQRRLWFISQFIADDTSYHAPLALRTVRQLEWNAFQAAWAKLADRHEALRTTFTATDGVLEARVGPASRLGLRLTDLQGHPDAQTRLDDAIREDLSTPFDLERGPMGRVTLALLPDGGSVIHVTLHHIVTDLWSTATLVRELITELEQNYADGTVTSLPDQAFQYSDYAVWEQRQTELPSWIEHERYLLSRLAPPPAPLDLPADYPRPEVQSYAGEEFVVKFAAGSGERVRQFAATRGLTPFMVLMAAYLILLRRLTGADDLTVGMPIAGREQAQFQNVLGFFVATGFVRVDMSEARSPAQLLDEVKRQCHEVYRCQDYPFDMLVSKANVDRPVDRAPVFSTMVAYQDLPPLPDWARTGPGAWQLLPLPSAASKFDLDLAFWPEDGELLCEVTYSTALFRRSSAESFASLFEQCLDRLLEIQ